MDGVDQNTKRWLAFAVVLVLVAALSLLNLYQISKIEKELGQIKGKLGISVVPKISLTPSPTKETIEVTGTIQYSDLEGGCWYIDLNAECQGDKCPLSETPKYSPVNLGAELKRIGVKAKFKLEVLPDVATICQLGPAVKILEYQIIK